jgi:hypothetical protein
VASSCLFAYGNYDAGNRLEVHVGDDRQLRLYAGTEGATLDALGAASLMQLLRSAVVQQPGVPEWVRAMAEADPF